jgi:hypothetical protein
MAEKKIEIRIAATGGSQAANEIGKVSDAAVEAQEAQADIARKSNIAGAAMIGAGIGGAILSRTFGEIADGINSINVEHLAALDPVMAAQVERAQEWGEALKDPVSYIQMLVSGSTIKQAFDAQNEQLALNYQGQQDAVRRMIDGGVKSAEELKEVARQIAAANAILAAADAADAMERDVSDAARIRAGEAPEDVRAERAAIERDRELERIQRGLAPEAERTQGLYDRWARATGNAERAKADPRANKETIDAGIKKAEEAKNDFEAAKKKYDEALAVAIEQRRGVRAKYEGTVGEARSDKETRLRREREKQQEEALRQQQEVERQRIEDEIQNREGILDRGAAGASGRFSAAGGRVSGGLSKTLLDIGDKLADGTNEKEVAAIAAKFQAATQGMGGQTLAALRQMIADQEKLAAEIAELRAQMKQSRVK